MILALSSNRTVLFLNNILKDIINIGSFYRPLKLGSCERQDIQCAFMSMCHSRGGIEPSLQGPALNKFRKNGVLGEEYVNERVIIVESTFDGHKILPFGLQDVIMNKITSLYKEINEEAKSKPLFQPAWDLSDTGPEKVYKLIRQKGQQKWIFRQPIDLYFTRPNIKSRNEINVKKALPTDFNAKSAIGLPFENQINVCVKVNA